MIDPIRKGENDDKIGYFLYARKSSEAEDRQVASIQSQVEELTNLAKKQGLEIVDILQESKSAKEPGRPVFNEMIQRLEKGEANGIICWKLDRLARNPIDGGQVSWMLQKEAIKRIQTFERTYLPSDNVLLMAVELGMANQFIRDLSQNTRRGLQSKAQRGWYPQYTTLGYAHNTTKKKGEKEIIKDPLRFDLVRKMFELMLTGNYTPQQILRIATNELGLRTKAGRKISRSNIYRIFTDSFYYGVFEYPKGSGNWYEGKHEPMITKEEYDRIQYLLGKKGKPRPKSHTFTYRGLMFCGECGAMITAEEKIKRQKNGNIHYYTYYHCTKRKTPGCTQKVIEEKELEKQVLDILGRIEIPKEFCEWAIKQLNAENQKEAETRKSVTHNLQTEYNKCLRKIDRLIDMRANGEITEDEFVDRKTILLQEKNHYQELLADADDRVTKWIDRAEEIFNFARDAKLKFETGTAEDRRSILSALGSNLTLKGQKLNISIEKPLVLLEETAREVKSIHQRFEPDQPPINNRTSEEKYLQSPMMLRRQDSNLQPSG